MRRKWTNWIARAATLLRCYGSSGTQISIATLAQQCIEPALYDKVLQLWPSAAITYYQMHTARTWDYAVKCPFLADALVCKYGLVAFESCVTAFEIQVTV